MSSVEQDYCCKVMDYYADPEYIKEHELIEYHPEVREYTFLLHGSDAGMQRQFTFYPWCRKKLPGSLREQWCKVMKKEFG